MFSATITGKIKRILFDNEKDGKDAMLKIVVEARKQYTKEDEMPNVYPVVAIFGHDAAYVREYAGVGHWVHIYNADYDAYRGEDDEYDRISFKAGKVEILPKAMAEAIAETIEEEDEDEGRSRRKKKSSKSSSKGKSRSERRKKRDEDEDEDESPRRSKRKSKASDGAKKKSSKKRDEDYDDYEDDDYDDDYDDDDYDDDDDDYFDE